MGETDILNGLNDRQREAVVTTEGPVLVIAGAGSGKTRVLTQRISYLINEKNVKPWNILAITFTNKAANEMKERLESVIGEIYNDVWIGTFHSICVRMLRKNIDKIGYQSNFNIYDTVDSKTIVKECMKQLDISDKEFTDKSVLSAISNLKNDMISVDKFEIIAGQDYRQKKIAQIYKLYQEKLKANNAVDFDDIILLTIEVLINNPETLMYYQEKFKYILVDEYQDTNKSQFQLINLLAGLYGNIFVVGDNDQSIYAFRGADITNILNFEKDYPGAKIVKLEQNYRSTQQILDVANEIIKNNEAKIQKQLWTDKKDGQIPVYNNVNNEYEEAQYISSSIQEGIGRGQKYSDYVILYRTNAQSRVVEDIFMKDRIPYKVIGGQKFYERKEIKDIVAYLRLIENFSDTISLRRVINEPKRGIGNVTVGRIEEIANINDMSMFDVMLRADEFGLKSFETIKDFAQMIKDFNEVKDEISIEELVNRVLEISGYMRSLEQENTTESLGRIENLKEFITTVIEFESESVDNTLEDFLENIALITDLDNLTEDSEYVTLMTMHNAKGLEFDEVFICGMEEGLFPSYRSMDEPNGIEEERRLCYVAVTRARKRLHLISSKIRTIFGNTSCNMPSRFIKEIPENMIEIKQKENTNIDSYTSKRINNITQFSYRTADSFLSMINNKQNNNINANEYKVNQKVNHKKFGVGIITNIEPEDDDLKLDINFERFGMKRLMANFAGLEILQ